MRGAAGSDEEGTPRWGFASEFFFSFVWVREVESRALTSYAYLRVCVPQNGYHVISLPLATGSSGVGTFEFVRLVRSGAYGRSGGLQ